MSKKIENVDKIGWEIQYILFSTYSTEFSTIVMLKKVKNVDNKIL